MGPLEVFDVDESSATVHWKPPEHDGGLPVKKYIVERRDAKRQAWICVDSVRPSTLTYTIERLIEGNDYLFRVFAANDEGVSEPLENPFVVNIRRPPGRKTFLRCSVVPWCDGSSDRSFMG